MAYPIRWNEWIARSRMVRIPMPGSRQKFPSEHVLYVHGGIGNTRILLVRSTLSTTLVHKVPMPNHPDGLTDIALACGMGRQIASHWRNGRRGMSKAAQLLYKLVQIHGLDALLSGELAQTPNKPAQDSTQVPNRKRTRKKPVK